MKSQNPIFADEDGILSCCIESGLLVIIVVPPTLASSPEVLLGLVFTREGNDFRPNLEKCRFRAACVVALSTADCLLGEGGFRCDFVSGDKSGDIGGGGGEVGLEAAGWDIFGFRLATLLKIK